MELICDFRLLMVRKVAKGKKQRHTVATARMVLSWKAVSVCSNSTQTN